MGGSKLVLTKKQKLLAGVVCAMIVLQLANSAQTMLNMRSNPFAGEFLSPLVIAMLAFGALLGTLTMLKFLLPGWNPHKKWLAWLLGGSLIAGLTGVFVLLLPLRGMLQNIAMTTPELSESLPFGSATAVVMSDAIYGIVIAVSIAALIFFILLSPYFHLLRGLIRSKSTERAAGALSAAWLGLSVIMLAGTTIVSIITGSEISGNPASRILTILIYIGDVILYYNWPVLTRPILEKIPEELVPGQEAQPAAEED